MTDWAKILDFPDYEVSRSGEIRSCRFGRERILSGKSNGSGYVQVKLHQKYLLAHRVVARAFLPNPDNLPHVDHINRIRTDNRVENLRWVSISDNMVNRNLPPNAFGYRCIYKGGEHQFGVCITRNYQKIYIGTFATLEEAIVARDAYVHNV